MEFQEVVRQRRMVRNFEERPVDAASLGRILDAGRRGPSAGFSQGVELLVLEGNIETERYWHCTFRAADRPSFQWPGLFRAPILIVVFASPRSYLDRYSQADKVATGLGQDVDAWPVPYWLTDASMAAMSMLLTAVDEGLGALFFGIFRGEDTLKRTFGVPDQFQAVGTIAVGHPAPDEPSRSVARGRRPSEEVVHRGRW